METPALRVEELTKRFGRRIALHDVSLAVPRGCAYGFLGPNGAGKTTLIKLLVGLQRATSGEIEVLGHAMPTDAGRALGRLGVVLEEPRFHAHLSARHNLLVAAAIRSEAAVARVDECLDRVGLTDRASERVKSFSLGMRQRLGLARALLADPELIVLDEPTNGLDPGGIHELRSLLRHLVAEGRTVFLSSHLITEIERICDFVAIVDAGVVVAAGALSEFTAGSTLEERFLALTGTGAAA
jgi:ABC-2 type transport system ATP-binding protein